MHAYYLDVRFRCRWDLSIPFFSIFFFFFLLLLLLLFPARTFCCLPSRVSSPSLYSFVFDSQSSTELSIGPNRSWTIARAEPKSILPTHSNRSAPKGLKWKFKPKKKKKKKANIDTGNLYRRGEPILRWWRAIWSSSHNAYGTSYWFTNVGWDPLMAQLFLFSSFVLHLPFRPKKVRSRPLPDYHRQIEKNKKQKIYKTRLFCIFHSVPSPLLSMSLQPLSSSHLSSVFLILQFSSSLSGLISSFSFKLGKEKKN